MGVMLCFGGKEEDFHSNEPAKRRILSQCQNMNDCDLKKCIIALSPDKYKQVLIELTPEQREFFFDKLSIEEYMLLLDHYNELEWTRLFRELSPQEKKHWPKTIQEQRDVIRNIKKKFGSSNNQDLKKELILFIKKRFKKAND